MWNEIRLKRLSHLTLVLFIYAAVVQGDQRCFLEKGGSVQNFFVTESLPIGGVIGDLEIVGNAKKKGDIFLRLENPKSSPVQISPNSKRLILTEKLDKEGVNGRSHIVINVICRKMKSDDVETKIPINIRVTDANDNSPVFVKSPYFVNVSEATVKGTVIVGDIQAIDNDQKGPFSDIHYSVPDGPHSSKFNFESAMSGALKLVEDLDYETDPLFNLTIAAEDRGIPPQRTETFITVHVIDSDDQNPAFRRQRYMSFLPSKPLKGTRIEIQPEPIFAEDQDRGIKAPIFYSLSQDVEEASYLKIDNKTGDVYLSKNVPNSAFRQPVALSVMATQVDNPDRVANVILSVSRRGTASNQLQFLQRIYEKTVNENLPEGTVIAKTLINKKVNEDIRYTLEYGGMGVFSISPSGEIYLSYELDYEKKNDYNLKIFVSDGEFSDTAILKVSVLNVNDWDPRFQYPQYAFYVQKNQLEPGENVGNVTVADGDGDNISLSLRGRDARMFSVNSNGQINVKKVMKLNKTEANLVLVAQDSGRPSRESSVPVTIHFPNDFVEAMWLGEPSSFLLMVVFGSLLALFILIIACLALYIHRNKKYRDDNDAAKPTKMSKIVSNGLPATKLSPLSAFGQNDGMDIPGVETPKSNGSIIEAGNTFRTAFISGTLRRSNDPKDENSLYSRNHLSNGSTLGSRGLTIVDVDSSSLNGSNATSSSTATTGSDSPPNFGSRTSTPKPFARYQNKPSGNGVVNGSLSSICMYDGTARATGGLPAKIIAPVIPPAPPIPPVPPEHFNFKSSVSRKLCRSAPSNNYNRRGSDCDSTSPVIMPNRSKLLSPQSTLGKAGGHRIAWPSSTIPKKVKKLSWEDELNNQTELNPEVSVTPMPPNHMQEEEAPNLTVYF